MNRYKEWIKIWVGSWEGIIRDFKGFYDESAMYEFDGRTSHGDMVNSHMDMLWEDLRRDDLRFR